jgi:hypothetical protein
MLSLLFDQFAKKRNRMHIEHHIVYQEKGKFGGWPANYGMWSWGDEIVVSFTQCTHLARAGFHARAQDLPAYPLQSRSLDGGLTWETIPTPARSPGQRGFSADEHMLPELRVAKAIELGLDPLPQACLGGINFRHPDFALLCARTGLGTGTTAWFYTTQDRAHTWQGPYSLPLFGLPGVEARTDFIVNAADDCLLFLTASRDNGDEGAGVFMARTADGGKTFSFISWVVSSPTVQLIMPSSLRLNEHILISTVRARDITGTFESAPAWIDLYRSIDNGQSWQFLSRPVPDSGRGGNPPSMLRLHDGRICLTYGYRAAPFGIHARLSEDGGQTWGKVIPLRDDGGGPDLGYTRTIQRPDGALVTTYYFNEHMEKERYIAATIWEP